MLGPLLQPLRRFEHEQREHRSHAQNPGRSPGKQKDLGFTPAGRLRAWRTAALPCCAAPCRAGALETEPSLQTAPLSVSPPPTAGTARPISGSLEGSSTFSVPPSKDFYHQQRHSFPKPALITTAVRLESCDVTVD